MTNLTEYSSADQFFTNAAAKKASERRAAAKRQSYRTSALSCLSVGILAVFIAPFI